MDKTVPLIKHSYVSKKIWKWLAISFHTWPISHTLAGFPKDKLQVSSCMNTAAERLRGCAKQSKLPQVKQKVDIKIFSREIKSSKSMSLYEDSVCLLHPWFTSCSNHDQDIRCGRSPVSSLREQIYVKNLRFWLSGDPQVHMLKGLLCLIS